MITPQEAREISNVVINKQKLEDDENLNLDIQLSEIDILIKDAAKEGKRKISYNPQVSEFAWNKLVEKLSKLGFPTQGYRGKTITVKW